MSTISLSQLAHLDWGKNIPTISNKVDNQDSNKVDDQKNLEIIIQLLKSAFPEQASDAKIVKSKCWNYISGVTIEAVLDENIQGLGAKTLNIINSLFPQKERESDLIIKFKSDGQDDKPRVMTIPGYCREFL